MMKRFRAYSKTYLTSVLMALGVGFMLGLLATAVFSLLIFFVF